MPGRITIRPAGEADRATIVRLAELDSTRPPHGEVLLGCLDGEPVAALGAGDRVVADPFRPTVELVELMRMRARGRERRAARLRRSLRRPLPAWRGETA